MGTTSASTAMKMVWDQQEGVVPNLLRALPGDLGEDRASQFIT